eukprot:CAMPEP_0183395806 /NCGR_PEP_ID=MMETSP0370-20130417/9585_1 /TAXON_ID=268820 /ORGANISM="Peridinium aciculiferum, Strain PAER-2" /LENGTH=69 /DNA_ID=CAMNT_0025576491 /DNA_START=130 /DNA_END=340 /DNA_ORIENTATION=-
MSPGAGGERSASRLQETHDGATAPLWQSMGSEHSELQACSDGDEAPQAKEVRDRKENRCCAGVGDAPSD